MEQEKYDKILYDIVVDIWDAYRQSTKSKNAKPFNEAFQSLYAKHKDSSLLVTEFIADLGIAFAPHVNRAMRM